MSVLVVRVVMMRDHQRLEVLWFLGGGEAEWRGRSSQFLGWWQRKDLRRTGGFMMEGPWEMKTSAASGD